MLITLDMLQCTQQSICASIPEEGTCVNTPLIPKVFWIPVNSDSSVLGHKHACQHD